MKLPWRKRKPVYVVTKVFGEGTERTPCYLLAKETYDDHELSVGDVLRVTGHFGPSKGGA